MIIICSDDNVLVKQYAALLGRGSDVKQLPESQKLKYQTISHDDLLIIDLNRCKESMVPVVSSPAIALAAIPDYLQAMRLLQKGVRGYGNRHMHNENLLQALTAVRAGQVWLPPEMITKMITSMPDTEPVKDNNVLVEPLSKREEEVVALVTKGMSNKEIAEKIHVSVRTVKAHLTSVYAKTGFRDRLELAVNMKNT